MLLTVFWAIPKFDYEARRKKLISWKQIRKHYWKSRTRHTSMTIDDIDGLRKYRITISKQNMLVEIKWKYLMDWVEKKTSQNRIMEIEKKIKERKGREEKKYLIQMNGKTHGKFDSSEVKYIVKSNRRSSLIDKTHINLIHRVTEYFQSEMRKKFFWPEIKLDKQKIIEKCEIRQISKSTGTRIFVKNSYHL